jgi:hypothetical protein
MKPIAVTAHDLGIAESCLRRWMKQDDIVGYEQVLHGQIPAQDRVGVSTP